MEVDSVSYENACNYFSEISMFNHNKFRYHRLPYIIDIMVALGSAIASFPMVFSKSLIISYNKKYVTTNMLAQIDLETPLEVGS